MNKAIWNPQIIKVAEWNIHMMSRVVKNFPSIIYDTLEIKNYFYDIIVLIEYKQNLEFEEKLHNNGYRVFTNSPLKKNEVLIAIKKELIMEVVEVNKNIPLNVGEIHPNFLHVKFKSRDKIISVIGIRNLFGEEEYRLQMKAIKRYLAKIADENIIVVGDFNAISKNIEKFLPANFHTYQPIHNRSFYNTENFINNYSYFFTEDDKTKNSEKESLETESDNIIKGMNALDFCISNMKGITNLSYSWNFIEHCDKYPKKSTIERNVTKWDIPVGYPDHALFTFVVDI
jgi:exonuclease III